MTGWIIRLCAGGVKCCLIDCLTVLRTIFRRTLTAFAKASPIGWRITPCFVPLVNAMESGFFVAVGFAAARAVGFGEGGSANGAAGFVP